MNIFLFFSCLINTLSIKHYHIIQFLTEWNQYQHPEKYLQKLSLFLFLAKLLTKEIKASAIKPYKSLLSELSFQNIYILILFSKNSWCSTRMAQVSFFDSQLESKRVILKKLNTTSGVWILFSFTKIIERFILMQNT